MSLSQQINREHTADNGPGGPEPGRHKFADRPQVYPTDVSGRFRRLKWAALIVLLAIYYVTPWLRWGRGPGIPDQAILIDLSGGRAYFFSLEIWPEEIYYLTGLLIIGAFGIFFITTLAGRIWCGFACPQTVWTDLFLWVERLTEGRRADRIRLDRAPWSLAKFGRKTMKHSIWLVISVLTGGAWIFYFYDAPTLARDIVTGSVSSTVLAFAALFTATTYFLAGWAREQVCIYVCPWRSFQSAMLDKDSFVVTYEDMRGEPRHPVRRSQGWDGRSQKGWGDCVDCKACVYVCPTGTDIREGQQISCIGCGLCVDACNNMMAQLGRPGDLVMFDTQSNQMAKARGCTSRVHLLRPRTILYAAIMMTVAGLMMAGLLTRATLDLNVLRDRSPLFVQLHDGSIQNAFTVKILNKTHERRRYRLTMDGLPGARLVAVDGDEAEAAAAGATELHLAGDIDTVTTYRVLAHQAGGALHASSTDIAFILTDLTSGETARHVSIFRAP
jgi:cytochrome c oxidase accessory protein FixG